MTKKQMRSLNQQRNKRFQQNARAQESAARRRKELADFNVEIVEPADLSSEMILSLAGNKQCFFCDEPLTDEEIVFYKFVALRSKSKQFYFVHSAHVYEDDLTTPLPDMQKNLTDVYMKIFEAEKGHLFQNPATVKKHGGEAAEGGNS